MKKLLSFSLSLLVTLTAYAFDNRFDTIVIFGDSLSDNGNLYNYLLHYLPASPPYFEGRFSNGPVWVEYLYNSYFPETYKEGFQNYAVGGAGAILSTKGKFPFSLTAEIDDYFYWHTYGNKETSLYIIWIGANNYINGPTNVEQITDKVTQSIATAVERLIAKGGNKFLIINLPDLARIPEVKNASKEALLAQLTLAHNNKLAQKIDTLQAHYPDSLLLYFDAYSFFNAALEHPADYGITNVDDPCYLGGYTGLQNDVEVDDDSLFYFLTQRSPKFTPKQWLMIKNNPQLHEAARVSYLYTLLPLDKRTSLECENYLFWDKVHPTTVIHQFLAQQVNTMITDVGLIPVIPSAMQFYSRFMNERAS